MPWRLSGISFDGAISEELSMSASWLTAALGTRLRAADECSRYGSVPCPHIDGDHDAGQSDGDLRSQLVTT